MCIRNSNLPDGCNRMDTSYPELDGYDMYSSHEEYVLDNCFFETITKENFTRIMADEIEEQQKFDEFIEDYFDDSIKSQEGGNEMIKQNIPHVPSEDKIEYCFHGVNMETCIGCGECKIVLGWTPEGALSGKPIVVRTLEEQRTFNKLEKAKSWKDFSKETHQLVESMRFARQQSVISPSRELPSRSLPIDFANYIDSNDCNVLFERRPKGIDI